MSLQPPALPKRPVFGSPVLSTQPKAISFGPRLPRFGGKDVFFGDSTLPEWTNGVKDPQFTQLDLQKKKEALAKALSELDKQSNSSAGEAKKKNWINPLFQDVRYGFTVYFYDRKLSKEYNSTSQKYLPKVNKEQLFRYNFNPRKWYFKLNPLAEPDLVFLRMLGPDALKDQQMIAEGKLVIKPFIEILIDQYSNPKEKPSFLESATKKVIVFGLKLYIKHIDKSSQVLNNVPPLPKKMFKKQLDELTQAYNTQFPDDPVTEVVKAIKAGSIGQVFEGKTKSGKKLVLKVVKPEITPAYLDEYRKFLYFRQLVLSGATEQTRAKAAEHVNNTVHLLKMETQSKQETINTRQMKAAVEGLNLKGFTVPEVLAYTEHGMVLPFVGEKDFQELNNLESGMKYRHQIAPDLLRLLTLSNVKPLDIHSGNIRVGGDQAYLIDHGRQVALKDTVNKALLGLTSAVYSSPLGENLASNRAIRDQLKALYQLNPEVNNEYTQALNKLSALDGATDEAAKNKLMQDLSPELKKMDTLLVQLFQTKGAYGEMGNDQAFMNRLVKSGNRQENHLDADNVSLLNLWTNYASQSKRLGLPDLSEQPLSLKDLSMYQQKASKFLAPYFQSKVDSKTYDTLADDLKKEKLEDLLPAADLALQPESQAGASEYNDAKARERKIIKGKIEWRLNSGETKGRMLQVYGQHQKVAAVSKQLITDISAVTKQKFTAAQNQVLNENLQASIRNDFNLTSFKDLINPVDYTSRLNEEVKK